MERSNLRVQWPVRKWLVLLVLVCLLPGVVGAVVMFFIQYRDGRARVERDAILMARAMVQAVDNRLINARTATEVLATSPYLATQDLEDFHRQAEELLRTTDFGNIIVLSDPDGQQLVNTLRRFGDPLPQHGNMAQLHQVITTGKSLISDVYLGGVMRRPVISIDVPVKVKGRLIYVLSVGILPDALGQILHNQKLPAEWVAGVFDRNGTIAARTHMAEEYVGKSSIPEYVERLQEVSEGVLQAKTREGIDSLIFFSRSHASGWSVAIARPRQFQVVELQNKLLSVALGIVLLFVLGSVLALTIGGRIAGSVRSLIGGMHSLGAGQSAHVGEGILTEVHEVAQAMEEASQILIRRNRALQDANAALRESEAHFNVALAQAPVTVFEQDLELRYTWICSPIWGYAGNEVIGKNDAELIEPDCAATLNALKRGVIASEQAARQDVSVAAPGGSLEYFDYFVGPRRNEAGQVIGVICAATNITRRRRESDLLRLAKADAEDANNAKSRFLAAASHDLRQPLAALRLYANVLRDKVTPTNKALVASMEECISSMTSLLTDLLDLSKLEAGVVKPKIADFSVFELLANLESVYTLEARAKGLRLRFVPSHLAGRSDPILIQRIIGNFIENAIRYTERGGVVIGCRRRQGRACIEVWDSGIGIAADQTREIFEEFKQLGDEARSHGSGLGLAIAAKTAALLGLEISVRSWLGRGSVFALDLPLGQAPATMPAAAPPALALGARRIALVDDNAAVRKALATALQSLGHQVVATDSKAALLAEFGTFSPDIVVSDYRLPHGETGFDVITAVRERLGDAVPAILITGDTDPNLVRSMTERGIIVLHKPLELETLQKCVEDLTGQAV